MTIQPYPVWSFEANWTEEVRETLEWLTDVMTSPSGAEQRRILRKYPRRTFEFSIAVQAAARALMDKLLMTHSGRDWYLPIWHEVHLSTAALSVGTDFIPCTTATEGELAPGEIIFVSNGAATDYELAEIEAIDVAGISLAGTLGKAWSKHARIHPVRRARFTDQPEPRRNSDNQVTAQVRFISSQPNNDAAPDLGLPVYRGFGVLSAPPNETDALDYGYDRLLEELDNQTGVPYRVDTAGLAFPRQKYNWLLKGRSQQKAFRKLIYGLYGRAVPIWIPTFFQDFYTVESTPPGEAYLVVQNAQFTALGGATDSRRDICIEMIDGTKFYRRILSSAVLSGNRESLGLDSVFPSGLASAAILRVSFMSLFRLDQDQVEIIHRTDSAGIAEVSTTFRAAPDLRQTLPGI